MSIFPPSKSGIGGTTSWPEHLQPKFSFVELSDKSTFVREMKYVVAGGQPVWMQPPGFAMIYPVHTPDVFVVMDDGEQYEFELITATNRPDDYNPNPHFPKSAELHYGNKYYVAVHFQRFTFPADYAEQRHWRPPKQHIYVRMPRRIIFYYAELHIFRKPQIEIQARDRAQELNARRTEEMQMRRETLYPGSSSADIYVQQYRKERKWK